MDQATRDLDLDFMIYFSSLAGVTGNIGQADYASANAWLDNYAQYRNDLTTKGKRKGMWEMKERKGKKRKNVEMK